MSIEHKQSIKKNQVQRSIASFYDLLIFNNAKKYNRFGA